MPVIIEDGYTMPFATEAEYRDKISGDVLAANLPVVAGRYRPATFEEMQTFRHGFGRADGKGQAKLVGELVAAHVVDWDAQQKVGADVSALPITPANVLRMGEPIANQLLDIVATWAMARQGTDAGN